MDALLKVSESLRRLLFPASAAPEFPLGTSLAILAAFVPRRADTRQLAARQLA